MADLTVIDGGKADRPHFIGVDILTAAVEFVDAHLTTSGSTSLGHLQRAEMVIAAAKLISEAEFSLL
ncbi:MAG TPA: hypothetical protein VNC22_03205 [Sporichthya sp.]|nr:hypothetical protein [Sporichthya sp.]